MWLQDAARSVLARIANGRGKRPGERFNMNDRDESIISNIQRDIPQQVQPKCPRCAYAPLEFHSNVVRTGVGHLVSIIWCGHCGHTLQAQFVGMDQQQGPRIVRPS